MQEADKLAAETDARQKDDVIRSKDQLIAQKNELVAEKDSALRDRLEALQQKVYFLAYLLPVLRSTCSWWVTTYVGKPSAVSQPTRPTQPFILSGSISE